MRSQWVAVMLGLSLIASDGRRSGGVGAAGRRRESRRSGEVLDLISVRRPVSRGRATGTRPSVAHTPADGLRPRARGWSPCAYTLPLEAGAADLSRSGGRALQPRSLRQAARDHWPTQRRREGRVIAFTLAEGARCVPLICQAWRRLASRSSRSPAAQARSPRRRGEGRSCERWDRVGGAETETWTGTLEVPGLELRRHCAEAERGRLRRRYARRRARRAPRVTFKVTATDDVDGAVPVSCQPKSGSRFKLGRTTVVLRGDRLQRQHRQRRRSRSPLEPRR